VLPIELLTISSQSQAVPAPRALLLVSYTSPSMNVFSHGLTVLSRTNII